MTHRRVYRSSSHFLVRDALLDAGPRLVPAAGIVHDLDYRQHDWNFNQDSDDGGKRSAGLKPKRLIAAATASSKKLLAPIKADGAATQ